MLLNLKLWIGKAKKEGDRYPRQNTKRKDQEKLRMNSTS